MLGNGGSGGPAEKNNLPSHSYLTLGYVALALAVVGAITARKRKETPFWVISGVVFLLLAMGPQLQIGLTATGIPLPFKLLESLPGIDAVGKVERFTVMTRLSMGVLAAWGAITVLTWLGSIVRGPQYARVALPLSAVLALLLVELPIYPRYMQPLGIPGGFETLASLKDGGGLMELPVTAHQDEVVGERMLFQTEHDHPIMGGYLSRAYTSPIMDSCGPFWSFISASYLPIEGTDIVSPTMESRPQDVLNFYNLKYIANYAGYGGPGSEKTFPVDPKDRAAYQDILDHVSHAPPLYKDSYVEIRKVDPVSTDSMVPSLLTANGWYNLEGGSVPFRWVKDGTATMCVFSPQAIKADLLMEGTAFGQQRDMQISVTGTPGNTTPSQSYKTSLPPGGSFAPVKAPFTFGAGMTEVVLTSPGPGTTPQSLDPANKDARPLTVGLRNVRLENVQPAP